jgi:hypothetical protein
MQYSIYLFYFTLESFLSLVQWLTPVILATWEAEIRKIIVSSLWAKRSDPISTKIIWAWWHTSVILAMWEA